MESSSAPGGPAVVAALEVGAFHHVEADEPVALEVGLDSEGAGDAAGGGEALFAFDGAGEGDLDGVVGGGGDADAAAVPLVEHREALFGFFDREWEGDVA